MQRGLIAIVLALLVVLPALGEERSRKPEFQPAVEFGEQVRWKRLGSGVRVYLNRQAKNDRTDRLLVLFATPNGNTIEQSLGCQKSDGLDYRYDIQHVAAQIRQLRALDGKHDLPLAVVQSPKLAWPAFRQAEKNAGEIITGIVRDAAQDLDARRIVLSCHSGGGSFIFGYIDAHDEIPASIERIVFLDANYSYSEDKRHGDKLLAWLRGDAARRLVVVAYDDREIVSGGKKVVGPTGGTFRATQRMLDRFRRDLQLDVRKVGPFEHTRAMNGQIECFVHPNAENKILHTALVGEMNGLLQGLTVGTPLEGKWGTFGGPRSYTKWVQKSPTVEPAPASPHKPDAPARNRNTSPKRQF